LDAIRNVGIVGDTVARITADPIQGKVVIEAGGSVVAPGFIELFQHAHDPESYRLDALDGVTSSLDLEVFEGGTLDLAEFKGRSLLPTGTTTNRSVASRTAL